MGHNSVAGLKSIFVIDTHTAILIAKVAAITDVQDGGRASQPRTDLLDRPQLSSIYIAECCGKIQQN